MRTLLWLALAAAVVPGCGSGGGGGGGGGGATTYPNDASPLGTNLSSVEYWSPELVFVDVFKHASAWIPQLTSGTSPWNTGAAFAGTTSDGYPLLNPGQAACAILCWAIDDHYPGGTYVCLYDGAGTIEFRGAASILSQTPGRIEVNVNPSLGGIMLRILATNPGNPVRNIRLIMPGYEQTYATQVFTPEFLARWDRFKVLRFMDWAKTNGSTQTNWSDRATPSWYTQAGPRGVAPEYMIDVCNRLNADAWVCVPHLATDAYVRELARLFRDALRPGLKVYVEHSNEVWNGIFAQAPYAQSRGLALGLSANAYEAQLRYHSQRSVEIFNLFEQEFGGLSRLVRVLAAQAANPWTGTTIMNWQNAYLSADAVAIAPYFGGYLGAESTQSTVAAMTVPEIHAACLSDITTAMGWVSSHVANANARGLETICYEAGQHLAGVGTAQSNTTLTNLFVAANRDAGMKPVLRAYLDAWRGSGGTLLVQFSSMYRYGQYGSWGALEWHDQATSPKYEALLEFIAANPRWW